MTHIFHAPQAIHTGAGCRGLLPECAASLGLRRVLIVTDAFLTRTGTIGPFVESLEKQGIATEVFDRVQPDPTDANVADGVAAYRQANADGLVAIGGGSPIDAAKVIAVSLTNPGPLEQFQGYHRVAQAGPPVIVIPTTAGTGSEATKAAVITDTTRHVKMMMLDAKLMPRIALVDYELSLSMPPALTAHVGVDTLTHGLEAYVSRKANALTDPLAVSCIALTARHLRTAWSEPGDREARAAMAVAALQGGMAFTNSGLCLVHGMSRPLGAIFHLAHGLSNAVLLPTVTRYSLPGAPARYAEVARIMGLANAAHSDEAAGVALVQGLRQLNQDLAVPTLAECLGHQLGHQRDAFWPHLRKMASDALASGSPANNPRVPTEDEIVALYEEAYLGGSPN
ncbi:MAG: iron-containing alcohol dehydrogenase [Bryobacteraceae bacterium]|nr:iron-containing alcohol dehydrogenase [Bryobacteraceae bacterium]